MRFLMIQTPSGASAGAPPSKQLMDDMQKLIERETRAGVLVLTGGLSPVSKGGARVRSAGGRFSVVDGPFTESKEISGGFAVIEVKSREEAIEASRRFFAVAGDGEAEIHQIM